MALSSPPKLVLDLGIGDTTATVKPPPPVLTLMQLKELQHQALIYNCPPQPRPPYLENSGGFCFRRPPPPHGMNYSFEMEPEPGRCRRTDGKKWRCSRDIVPDHKYCEHHVHRGRSRSRKPVELVAPAADTPVIQSNNGINLSISEPNVGGFRKYTKSSGNASPTRVVGFSPSSMLQGSEAAAAAGKAG